jgi:F-type H+-transporting ATPase subunit c
MRNTKKALRLFLMIMTAALLFAAVAPAFAQEHGGGAGMTAQDAIKSEGVKYAYLGAALGAGMVVIGAGLGIGKFAAAAADGVARQPQAAAQITGAVQLPLFLLEGVAVIGVVTCLLIVVLK